MKKIISVAVIALLIFSLSACGGKKPTIIALDENKISSEQEKSTASKAVTVREKTTQKKGKKPVASTQKKTFEKINKSLPFKAQYIRTYGSASGSDYQKTFMISSTDELADYINNSEDADAFSEFTEKYDSKFFQNHELIAVMLKEGSGSITHEVENVVFTQSADGKCSVQPVIKRIVPEVGTCDMAYWHIIIEIGRDFGETSPKVKNAVIK